MAEGNKFIPHRANAGIIMLSFGQFLDLAALHVGSIDLRSCVPYAGEVNSL